MNKLFLALSVLSLGAPAPPSLPHSLKAAVPRSRPARLEGMNYVPARHLFLLWPDSVCHAVREGEPLLVHRDRGRSAGEPRHPRCGCLISSPSLLETPLRGSECRA